MTIKSRLNQYGTLQAIQFDEVTPIASNKVGVNTNGKFYASEFIENVDVQNYSNIYQPYDITNDLVAQPFFGTGIYYAGGSLTANTYSAYDLLTGEVAQPLYGPGQGTYMRYTMDNKCITYNDIDEVTDIYNRGIITSGLVLDLDADIQFSYGGSGNSWNDLSGLNNNGLISGAVYNSTGVKNFIFNGSASVNCRLSSFQPTQITLCAWVRHDNTLDGGIIVKGDVNEPTEWGISFGYNSPHLLVGRATTFNNQLTWPWTGSLLTGYHYVCYTMINNTRARLYVDGELVTSTNTIGSIGLNTKNVLIGGWNNYGPLIGNVAQAMIYDRELSPQEIKQNYDALKHRFLA